MAATQFFTIEKGATWAQNLIYQDSLGAAIDLTGFTARMQIKKKLTSEAIVSLTDTAGITITPLTGVIDLRIEAAITDTLNAGKYIYDLELVNGTEVTRLIEGTIVINENVTI